MDSIGYYNKYAAKVFEETVDQDMSGLTAAFLELLEEGDTILDLGCGSGRDSLSFYEHGYDVTPMDASEKMCRLAKIHTGLPVLFLSCDEMDFDCVFDGIWACASLIHIPRKEMSGILTKLARALKEGGVLFMSFQQGDFEGFRGERYFSDYTRESMEMLLMENACFDVIHIWETPADQEGHARDKWLNVLVRKR